MGEAPRAPGWYPDPTGRRRYWDGWAWHDAVPARPGPVPPQVPAQPTNWRALALLIGAVATVGVLGAVVISIVDNSPPEKAIPSDGQFHLITTEDAGDYTTVGPRGDETCHWALADKPTDSLEDIADIGLAPDGRNTTVTLPAGKYFVSWECYPWRRP